MKTLYDILKEGDPKRYVPRGNVDWWAKLPRKAQVKYRTAHPFTKKKARYGEIIVQRKVLVKENV